MSDYKSVEFPVPRSHSEAWRHDRQKAAAGETLRDMPNDDRGSGAQPIDVRQSRVQVGVDTPARATQEGEGQGVTFGSLFAGAMQLVIDDPLCKRCYHSKSEHVESLFGVVCTGKFWVPLDDVGVDKPCQCGGFQE